jgi:hypothetical protein
MFASICNSSALNPIRECDSVLTNRRHVEVRATIVLGIHQQSRLGGRVVMPRFALAGLARANLTNGTVSVRAMRGFAQCAELP